MKKQKLIQVVTTVVMLGAIFVLAGCDMLFNQKPQADNLGSWRGDYQAQTPAGKIYQNMIDLTVNTAVALAEKVFEYDTELADPTSPRSVRTQGNMDLMGLFTHADLSKTKTGLSRSVEPTNGVTLEDELNAIFSAHQEELQAFIEEYAIDDLSFLDGVNGISLADNLVIYNGDIILANTKSMDGIIYLHMLRSYLSSEDVDTIIDDMHAAASNYPLEQDSSRGVYKQSTPLWPNKKVNYIFVDDLPATSSSLTLTILKVLSTINGPTATASRNQFREAIADWQSKVPVQFINIAEFNEPIKQLYLMAAGADMVPLVVLKDDPNLDAAGQANVGGLMGITTCTIRRGLMYPSSIGAPRHELGHTLGLEHEHQRWDRDDYLAFDLETMAKIITDPVNWAIIPTFLYTTFPIVVQGTPIYVYVTIFTSGKNSGGTVEFDYKSIMLYSTDQIDGLRVKNTPQAKALAASQGLPVGGWIPYNVDISVRDIATVKLMY